MLTAKQIKGLFVDYWYLLALAVLLICLGAWLFFGGGKNEQELEKDINQQKGINAVIVNQVINAEKNVNEAHKQTNQAETNFNVSVNRDSNEFTGDSTNQFCRRFPCDSTCGEWRFRNEVTCR